MDKLKIFSLLKVEVDIKDDQESFSTFEWERLIKDKKIFT